MAIWDLFAAKPAMFWGTSPAIFAGNIPGLVTTWTMGPPNLDDPTRPCFVDGRRREARIPLWFDLPIPNLKRLKVEGRSAAWLVWCGNVCIFQIPNNDRWHIGTNWYEYNTNYPWMVILANHPSWYPVWIGEPPVWEVHHFWTNLHWNIMHSKRTCQCVQTTGTQIDYFEITQNLLVWLLYASSTDRIWLKPLLSIPPTDLLNRVCQIGC